MPQAQGDLVVRGSKEPSPAGTATFVGLRGIEPFFQYAVLRHGVGASLIELFGAHVRPQGVAIRSGIALIDGLGLSPYRLVLLSMCVGGSLKQNLWELGLAGEPMSVPAAFIISFFNFLLDSINHLLFLSSTGGEGPSSLGFPRPELVVGSSLFAVGILTEFVSEIQRAAFKSDAKNKGKPHTGGLFALSRHINYFGYTLWRSGYALAAGGWIWASINAAWFTYDFNARAIPILDNYCSQKYADMWKDYKDKTPYAFFPFVI